jgi:hypothetical protein
MAHGLVGGGMADGAGGAIQMLLSAIDQCFGDGENEIAGGSRWGRVPDGSVLGGSKSPSFDDFLEGFMQSTILVDNKGSVLNEATQADSAVHGLSTIFAGEGDLPHPASRCLGNVRFAGQGVDCDVVGKIGAGEKAAELDDVHAAFVT